MFGKLRGVDIVRFLVLPVKLVLPAAQKPHNNASTMGIGQVVKN
ncbi:hypothetical protein BH10PAT3_BH10PAT3_7530 [soil metagenome]